MQWLSGRVLDSRPRGCGFESHQSLCVVSLSKNINPSLVLVQQRKTCPFITERLLMGCKESKQSKVPFHLAVIKAPFSLYSHQSIPFIWQYSKHPFHLADLKASFHLANIKDFLSLGRHQSFPSTWQSQSPFHFAGIKVFLSFGSHQSLPST